MKYCDRCKISVRGTFKKCPLCQRPLLGTSSEKNCYPEIMAVYNKIKFRTRIVLFVLICIGLISVAINLIIPESGTWSRAVVFGLIYLWISMSLAIHQRRSIPKNITLQAAVVSIACVIMDFLTKWYGWSIDFVLPSVFTVAIISMSILAIATKIPTNDYIVFLLVDIVFGFIPMILFLLGLINHSLPSILCCTCSFICLAGILIFQGKDIIHELSKRFQF